jgi:hypothetical protein
MIGYGRDRMQYNRLAKDLKSPRSIAIAFTLMATEPNG